MSQLLNVLFIECMRVCSRMADRWSWMALCRKCQRVYHRYGEGSCEIPSEIADPLETFDDTNVEENVMRFVVYILWLKRQPDSFEKYLRVREARFDLWRISVQNLWRL